MLHRRLHRRLAAWLVALCVLFAQSAALAYACQRQAGADASAAVPCSAHLTDDGAAALPLASGNVCEVHCHPLSLPDAGPTDAPGIADVVAWWLPPLPVPVGAMMPAADLEARIASPPLRTLFARLTI